MRQRERKRGNHKHQKPLRTTPSAKEPVLAATISSRIGLSEDVLGNAPLIYQTGNYKICIENYKNIIEYTSELIRIQTTTIRIHVLGENLMVAYFRDDGMCVVGTIHAVEYHDAGGRRGKGVYDT